MVSKEDLDIVLRLYKAQPVGSGYNDIIVKREYIRQFVEEILGKGIQIAGISWWEYISSIGMRANYGLGGPKSEYYDGWFAEIGFGVDDISTDNLEDILNVIKNKVITVWDGEKIIYKQDEYLTPAFWLDVPEEWNS